MRTERRFLIHQPRRDKRLRVFVHGGWQRTKSFSSSTADAAERFLQNVDSQDENHYGPCSDAVDRALNKPDILVHNEGTIFPFQPLTPAAKQWIDENVQPNTRWFAGALVVEHRYAAELPVAMRENGLVLA